MEGVDMIKPEYVVTDHERVLNLDFVADSVKSQLTTEREEDAENGSGSKKKWKKKLKGQNKNRAVYKLPENKQLCSKVLSRGENLPDGCNNKRCRFLHDVRDFLKVKEPDLGKSCYVYETKGICPWGVACRFGLSHVDENGKNLENPSVKGEKDVKPSISLNKISYDTLISFRKRTYDFSKSLQVVKEVDKLLGTPKDTEEDAEEDDDQNGGKPDEKEILKRVADADESSNGPSSAKKIKTDKEYEYDASCEASREATCDQAIDTKAVPEIKTCGPLDDSDLIKLRPPEKKKIDWKDKLYLAPLTTLGNLPFRRICKEYGADVTCGEMALASSLLRGDASEWSLVKRHSSEDLYGVQIAANNPFLLARASQALRETCELDFIDINLGCPLDHLYRQGIGSGMLMRPRFLKHTAASLNYLLDIPYTFKVRMGCKKPVVHNFMPWMKDSGLSLITIHGRSREQRYTKNADWDYVEECAKKVFPVPVFGNGDVLSYEDYARVRAQCPTVQGVMIGRGALMKPWIFQEIKEKRIMDPSSSERLDMLRRFTNYGLDHWGSDNRGVENTRRFLLEWLSFLYRYVPSGLLANPPQSMNQRPPYYKGRDDLETLMASPNAQDWVKISEMLLGSVPDGFVFLPKHKANAWK
ncbi:tRNA-dihydrouridine synthase [Nesidiocoris tenuis]|uniref:tRNA-dihydrouridine(47) synthase [NAD(P)(+)] n=1 Tax=Nesidiocoris tenuis TaxID=355587 RepID=A0ABN7B702_9HEMI|nr:tRNA-dihydrouridine synthase [Nesidiocoris tenuis]